MQNSNRAAEWDWESITGGRKQTAGPRYHDLVVWAGGTAESQYLGERTRITP